MRLFWHLWFRGTPDYRDQGERLIAQGQQALEEVLWEKGRIRENHQEIETLLRLLASEETVFRFRILAKINFRQSKNFQNFLLMVKSFRQAAQESNWDRDTVMRVRYLITKFIDYSKIAKTDLQKKNQFLDKTLEVLRSAQTEYLEIDSSEKAIIANMAVIDALIAEVMLKRMRLTNAKRRHRVISHRRVLAERDVVRKILMAMAFDGKDDRTEIKTEFDRALRALGANNNPSFLEVSVLHVQMDGALNQAADDSIEAITRTIGPFLAQ